MPRNPPTADLVSRPSAASAACASGTRAGTQGKKREAQRAAVHRVAPGSRVSLRSPGTRGIGGARSEPLAAVSTHDVNSAVFFVPAARLCARVCPSVRLGLGRSFGVEPAVALAAIPAPAVPFRPDRGVDGAPTGHSFVLSRVRGATSEPCGAACPVANGTSLGAPPWRFSAGDRCRRLRECKDRNRQRLVRKPQGLAEGSLTSRGSGSRRNRGTPLPAPPSGSSPETPLMSEDANLVL